MAENHIKHRKQENNGEDRNRLLILETKANKQKAKKKKNLPKKNVVFFLGECN